MGVLARSCTSVQQLAAAINLSSLVSARTFIFRFCYPKPEITLQDGGVSSSVIVGSHKPCTTLVVARALKGSCRTKTSTQPVSNS